MTEKKTIAKKSAPVKKATGEVKKSAAKPAVKKLPAKKVVAQKAAHVYVDKAEGTVKIQQVASGAGRHKSQVATLKGLALNKIGRISELENTGSVRGMIAKVKHLLRILK